MEPTRLLCRSYTKENIWFGALVESDQISGISFSLHVRLTFMAHHGRSFLLLFFFSPRHHFLSPTSGQRAAGSAPSNSQREPSHGSMQSIVNWSLMDAIPPDASGKAALLAHPGNNNQASANTDLAPSWMNRLSLTSPLGYAPIPAAIGLLPSRTSRTRQLTV
jgi:hypothetical protein